MDETHSPILNLQSERAKRARLAKTYDKKSVKIILRIVLTTSLAFGILCIVAKYSIGWVVFVPGVISYMLLAWIKGDLSNTKPNPGKPGLENILDFYPLARLQTNEPSAYDIWQSLVGSEETFFIANRFLIPGEFFETLLSKEPASGQKVWQIAENFRTKYQEVGISNANLMVSLVVGIDRHDQVLKNLKLDAGDLETAIPWMRDIKAKRKLAKENQVMGGIGRDWAYGYTPTLQALGHNISQDIETHGFFSKTTNHNQIVGQMSQMLNSGNGTVTLVGESGVGKTTCVHAFANHILTHKHLGSIDHHQIIEMDASSLLSNARSAGELESIMIRILNEAHKARNIILFFDDAEMFFGNGQGSVDISHVIQPALESSSLKLILAMSPSAWQRLTSVGITSKMQPLNISPADEENTLAVLRDSIFLPEFRNKSVFTYQALREGYKLGKRYVDNIAMPGAALKILEQTATTNPNQLITREAVQASVEQTYGIKLQASTADESSKLLGLEDELKKYVISQTRAITVVADALRRARSGVGNSEKPVGTFLFLGPTGVGKTELAKALARTYFGDEKSIIRLDMNQFVNPEDVARLIKPMAGQELGFLGEVRRKPFSVVLLDEIEKAHSSVVNSFLQMLDEGVMRDDENREVSFKDAIVIATSNAGADKIREYIESGQDTDGRESEFIETLISGSFFAPEFINRFDEVVIFKPLTQQELIEVVNIMIEGVNRSLDSQKVRVSLTDEAKIWLVEKGYDSKLGARPMRRMVQRYVENTIAKKLLSNEASPGSVINLDKNDFIE